MTELRDRITTDQRFRVSMNVKHFCVQSGDHQLVQLDNGQYGQLPVKQIEFHREGEHNSSPWTRWYDMNDPEDREAIEKLRLVLDKHPNLQHDVDFRIRIVGEFEGMGEPWPGYDDQDAEQIKVYYGAMSPVVRPELETVLQYELTRETPNEAKITAIEAMHRDKDVTAKKTASAGVKL